MTTLDETFSSADGICPMSAITGSARTINWLISYGLAVDKRLRGVRLTTAGWKVLCMLPLPPEHRATTWITGASQMNWRKARIQPSRRAAWSCTCGQTRLRPAPSTPPWLSEPR